MQNLRRRSKFTLDKVLLVLAIFFTQAGQLHSYEHLPGRPDSNFLQHLHQYTDQHDHDHDTDEQAECHYCLVHVAKASAPLLPETFVATPIMFAKRWQIVPQQRVGPTPGYVLKQAREPPFLSL